PGDTGVPPPGVVGATPDTVFQPLPLYTATGLVGGGSRTLPSSTHVSLSLSTVVYFGKVPKVVPATASAPKRTHCPFATL
ncbi:hypothetical protein ACQ1PQ_10970, partial [Ornithobacterium rhinotracheale]